MIHSSCHCRAVKLEIDGGIPDELKSCNCSICRRYGGLMAYYHPSAVRVIAAADATHRYVWGDKVLAFVRCANCGCMTHWESLDPNQRERMGINARMFEDIDIAKIRVRHFDGAKSWSYIDW